MPTKRQIKFTLLEWLVLPVGLVILRAWLATLRFDREELAALSRGLEDHPVLVVTYHGNALAMLAASRRVVLHGKRICVMSSPSRDGRLMEKVVRAFGLTVVKGSSASRSIAVGHALAREVLNGAIGLITIDGPRGPRCVPKPGFLAIARAAGARVHLLALGTTRARTFRTWDRMYLPRPFSRVAIRRTAFDVPAEKPDDQEALLAEVSNRMWEQARSVACPVVAEMKEPPAMMVPAK